jgi:transcriptional regulator GlxA family with amidase domain
MAWIGHAEVMKTIALVLYPGITPLDLIGPLQVMSILGNASPDFETVVVAERIEAMPTDTPVSLTASHTFDQVPDPYTVIVPGGTAPTMRAMTDEKLIAYLRSISPTVLASVCTGAMILGAAGLLEGREATTHWSYVKLLSEFGAIPVTRRWVEDGPVLTAAGVSAGIDMALHLAGRFAGEDVSRTIQYAIEYDPAPPAGPLDWTKSPDEAFAGFVTAALRNGVTDDELRDRLLKRV